jgi:arylsulfatase A-like enzyme
LLDRETTPPFRPGGRFAHTILSVAIGFLLVASQVASASTTERPNVILILVDTLRADHLGAYGYSKGVSPHIDAFARNATTYENTIAQAPLTIPSVLQIMTSKYVQAERIADKDPTMAEILKQHDYETAAVVENANFELDRRAHGLLRGFDVFYRNGVLDRKGLRQQHWKTNTAADTITAQAIRYLRRRTPDRPLFLWLHYFDPHDPYMPPFADDMESLSAETKSGITGDIRSSPLRDPQQAGGFILPEEDRRHLVRLYDAEIHYADQSIGELLAFLERNGSFDGSLIVLSSDHGESFGEHGMWMHGRSLYDSEIHIPLIVKFPGQRVGKRVKEPTMALDILPTILDVAAIESDKPMDGTSLRHGRPDYAFSFWKEWQVARTDNWKLVQRGSDVSLYRLSSDSNELRDVSAESPDVVRRLSDACRKELERLEISAETMEQSSSAVVERMRALGYLDQESPR